MNSAGKTDQEQPSAPSLAAAVAAAPRTTAPTPLEPIRPSNAPYFSAQPTPNESMKMQSALPPIAMAKPLETFAQTHPQGIYHGGVNHADLNHPYATAMAMTPYGVSDDAQADNMRFVFLPKCRWMAGCLMVYYMATFLFLQPFVLGTSGLLTACVGLNGSRSPLNMHRLKWLRWYIWANYVMVLLNMWILIMTLIMSKSMSTYTNDAGANSAALFIGLLVASNTIMHLRCLRTAQLLVTELRDAGADQQLAPTLILAPNNPVSAV